jgi:hypothetical protein
MGLFKSKYERELDMIMTRLDMNMSNNYKDNAQDNLKELEATLNAFKSSGRLKPAVITEYEHILEGYREKMKGFRHKDQKPYWH